VSGFVYLLILKHHGATEGEHDNIKETKPDTDPSTFVEVFLAGLSPSPSGRGYG
jgi:hypothetical protein